MSVGPANFHFMTKNSTGLEPTDPLTFRVLYFLKKVGYMYECSLTPSSSDTELVGLSPASVCLLSLLTGLNKLPTVAKSEQD